MSKIGSIGFAVNSKRWKRDTRALIDTNLKEWGNFKNNKHPIAIFLVAFKSEKKKFTK